MDPARMLIRLSIFALAGAAHRSNTWALAVGLFSISSAHRAREMKSFTGLNCGAMQGPCVPLMARGRAKASGTYVFLFASPWRRWGARDD